MSHPLAYVVMFGPNVLLVAISLIHFRRNPGIVTAVAVLCFSLSAFASIWGAANGPALVPSTDVAGHVDYVLSGNVPSKWITHYLSLGGLWIGLLALLFQAVRQPTKGTT